MAITKKQTELDVSKWLKSEEAGHDMCGEFDFCAYCDKEVENPCAKAFDACRKAAKATGSEPNKTTARKTATKKTAAKK